MSTEHAGHEKHGESQQPMEDSNEQKFDPPQKDDPPSLPFSFLHEIVLVMLLCSSQLLTQAGLGNTVALLHIIGDSLAARSPGQLSWYVAAYSLTVGTFILIAGRLGDIFGHKRLFILGYFWYSLWSLVIGLSVYSHSQILFDICRAM